jgi:hypothetical protein
MATNIPVITQEELDPTPPSELEPTMVPTNPPTNPTSHDPVSTNPAPSSSKKTNFHPSTTASKKRFVQYTLHGNVSTHHLTKPVSVRKHKRKSPSAKATSPVLKKKIPAPDDCKESRSLALTLHIEELRNLMKKK